MGQVIHGKNLLNFEPVILSEEKLEGLIDEKLKLLELEALLINGRLESSQVVRFTGWRMSLSSSSSCQGGVRRRISQSGKTY